MKLHRPLTCLLPFMLAASPGPSWAQEVNWNGLARTVIEEGKDTLPNLVVSAKSREWQIDAALDLYEAPDGKTKIRPFFVTASYKVSGITTRCGLLPPFFNTRFNDVLAGALPPNLADNSATLNGGVVGCDVNAQQQLGAHVNLTFQAYAGTKHKNLSQDFGAPTSPGFDALVAGGGVSVSKTFDKGNIDAGYRYTGFGRGPGGATREQHYFFGSGKYKAGQVEFRILGEIAKSETCNLVECTDTTTTNIIAQTIGPLHENLDWRISGGKADRASVIDAGLVWRITPAMRIQTGVGYNFDEEKFYPALGASLTF